MLVGPGGFVWATASGAGDAVEGDAFIYSEGRNLHFKYFQKRAGSPVP